VTSGRRIRHGFRAAVPAAGFGGLCLLVAAGSLALPRGALAAGGPPHPTFTPDVRADGAEGAATNQNEPVVQVDQSGLTYITWQGAARPGGGATNTVTTTDGVHFNEIGSTDPGGQGGDVAMSSTSWPNPSLDTPVGSAGENGVFWADLGSNTCGPLGFRASTSSDQGATWAAQDAGCQPFQIDRDWIAAYTPPIYRGTPQAVSHTLLYDAYHDFGPSNVWVSRSTDGGSSWTTVQQSAIQPGSTGALTSFCNTYPGGVAVDQNGVHQGRVYVVWNTGDTGQNTTNGCNVTSGQPFDHVFLSYSDDGGNNWTTHAVFNDPCAPNPPAPPVNPTACQDTSEGWTPVAVDDAGNVYVAFTWIDTSTATPEYDVYLEASKDGGNTWNGGTIGPVLGAADHPGSPIDASSGNPGTNYYPELAAGGTGGIDLAWYHSDYTTQPGMLQKPAIQPPSAVWDVYLGQSLDVLNGSPFTLTKVTTHPLYFGDICTVGIACGSPIFNWAYNRTLFDNFGIAVGPDGGARITWTDARDSWNPNSSPPCEPTGSTNNSNVGCQTTHVYFSCQTSGLGIHGETVTGCGRSQAAAAATPEAPWVPALLAVAAALGLGVRQIRSRRSRRSFTPTG